MNEYEATIQINPTDDIKFILEEPGCFGLLAFLAAAVAKWIKLIDVIQYIAFAFGLGFLALFIGVVGLSLIGIGQNHKHKEVKDA